MPTPLQLQRTVPVSPAEVAVRLPSGTFERTIEVPAALRAFTSGTLKVVGRREWHGTTADITIDVQGQPVSVRGELRALEDPNGSVVEFDGVVTADVPFIGGLIETAVRDEVSANFEQELAAITD